MKKMRYGKIEALVSIIKWPNDRSVSGSLNPHPGALLVRWAGQTQGNPHHTSSPTKRVLTEGLLVSLSNYVTLLAPFPPEHWTWAQIFKVKHIWFSAFKCMPLIFKPERVLEKGCRRGFLELVTPQKILPDKEEQEEMYWKTHTGRSMGCASDWGVPRREC